MSHTVYLDLGSSRFVTDRETGEEPRAVRVAWWKDSDPAPVCRLIAPSEGMTIDPRTHPYHGITGIDYVGAEPNDVVQELDAAVKGAKALVAYNGDFHWRHLVRLSLLAESAPQHIPAATMTCAMKLAAPIVGIKAMRPGGGFKLPSLADASRHFNLPSPLSGARSPTDIGAFTVAAVRSVYQACLAHNQRAHRDTGRAG